MFIFVALDALMRFVIHALVLVIVVTLILILTDAFGVTHSDTVAPVPPVPHKSQLAKLLDGE